MQYTKTNSMTLLHPVKRNLTMNHYQKLIRYIDQLIEDKGKREKNGYTLPINDLDESEQAHLSLLYIEHRDRETADIFFDEKITRSLIGLLKNDSIESKENFATLVKDTTVQYCLDSLKNLIAEQCDVVFQCEMYEAGFQAKHHSDNGEIYWSRSA